MSGWDFATGMSCVKEKWKHTQSFCVLSSFESRVLGLSEITWELAACVGQVLKLCVYLRSDQKLEHDVTALRATT